MEVLTYILIFTLGCLIGCYFSLSIKTDGVLVIDRNDPDKDFFNFKIYNVGGLNNKKWIRLRLRIIEDKKK